MTASGLSVSHVSILSGWSCWLIALDSNSNLISTLAHTSDTAPPSESLNLGYTNIAPCHCSERISGIEKTSGTLTSRAGLTLLVATSAASDILAHREPPLLRSGKEPKESVLDFQTAVLRLCGWKQAPCEPFNQLQEDVGYTAGIETTLARISQGAFRSR